ncbi:hypothetical protein [Bacillus timonensis]|uniref:hypothetical protein n=1 Tax=Bacillus timonensis TaxID=1033734 RepID=UPI0002894A69|nr:hypothetical protein [Bacillus timonensis]
MKLKVFLMLVLSMVLLISQTAFASPSTTNSEENPKKDKEIKWRLVYNETFNKPFNEPDQWIQDTYGDDSPYHVGPYDEDGNFFVDKGGQDFLDRLSTFDSYRKSFTYGEDGWLTVELYGRDSDKDGTPETGGKFVSEKGKAKLISERHYDGAIIRPTNELPDRYRIEVEVSNINFGGKNNGSWDYENGKSNGYDGDEIADPWRFNNRNTTPYTATDENGVYFLAITDYPNPAPHNNVFIHHHRKVVMDTDNNKDEWSNVWNPTLNNGEGGFEPDGSQYISMIWLQGNDFGDDWTGNRFTTYTPDGFKEGGTRFVDKYIDGEKYKFAIERDGESYTMSVSGNFHYGGKTTYKATRKFETDPIWHYNQTADEYNGEYNQQKTFNGDTFDTWPEGSAYPDFFFFGDPHINYYEGTAEYDNLRLYVPKEDAKEYK